MALEQLQEIVDDLQGRGQVIFYGPPGAGKTYVAREIAKQCPVDDGDFELPSSTVPISTKILSGVSVPSGR